MVPSLLIRKRKPGALILATIRSHQGTSFAFISIMIPIVAGKGVEAMAALTTAALCGGLLHAGLSFFVGRIRFALPPMITRAGGADDRPLAVRIGVQYAAGGVPAIGTPAFGAWQSWLLAGVVVVTTLGLNFFGRGIWSTAAVLLGLLAGYGVALAMGRIDFAPVASAGLVMLPIPFHFGFAVSASAIIGFCATSMLSGVNWTQRNMLIFGVSLSRALGLQREPEALQHLPETLRILLGSGVLPAALTAVTLNLLVPGRGGERG